MIKFNKIKIRLTNRNVGHYKKFNIEIPKTIKNGKEVIDYSNPIEVDVSMLKEGSDQVIELYCDTCLEKGIYKTLYKKFNNLVRDRKKNNGKDGCVDCARSKSGSSQRLDFNIIFELFKSKNLIILFDKFDYKSINTKLKFRCKTHNNIEQYISYQNLLKSEYPCKICRHNVINNKISKSFLDLKKYFIKRGLNPIFSEKDFGGCNKKMEFTCNKHPNTIQEISYNSLSVTKNGCKLCFDKTGRNSHAWKGGITPLVRNMRSKLKEWSLNKLKESKYTCALSNNIGGKLVVHHIKNFHTILEEVLLTLDLKIYHDISNYSPDELLQIKNKLVELHKNCEYVVLCENLHKLFHKLYGKKNNTIEQFLEFKKRYENCEFDNILDIKYQSKK